jgi:lytic starch monooxygenase
VEVAVEIVDVIEIPNHLQPGNYVLQWRWDCEESDQV